VATGSRYCSRSAEGPSCRILEPDFGWASAVTGQPSVVSRLSSATCCRAIRPRRIFSRMAAALAIWAIHLGATSSPVSGATKPRHYTRWPGRRRPVRGRGGAETRVDWVVTEILAETPFASAPTPSSSPNGEGSVYDWASWADWRCHQSPNSVHARLKAGGCLLPFARVTPDPFWTVEKHSEIGAQLVGARSS
jgi:hypothetical protein